MRKLLVLSIVSICILGWRSGEIAQMLASLNSLMAPDTPSRVASVKTASVAASKDAQRAMSIEEFSDLSKTDPKAFQKFIGSHQVKEPNEADKLMNFFTRGKYE